jgi:hypothetical protein
VKLYLQLSWREDGPYSFGPLRNVSLTRPLMRVRWPFKTTPNLCLRVEHGIWRLCGYFVWQSSTSGVSPVPREPTQ